MQGSKQLIKIAITLLNHQGNQYASKIWLRLLRRMNLGKTLRYKRN